ncbi:hypothetical protein RRG08_065842 [Elysia crispata]|uniref:Uncharacterized protein n=1 Tax=Elysia crispata TaxID=231223 RepID=A0AAE0Z3Z5_9GAST|nr:hypothetical protein RRG08_065842 [Elysia crispata]
MKPDYRYCWAQLNLFRTAVTPHCFSLFRRHCQPLQARFDGAQSGRTRNEIVSSRMVCDPSFRPMIPGQRPFPNSFIFTAKYSST